MPSPSTIVVKLGGSVVTEKSRGRPAIRRRLVRAIGRVIKQHWSPKTTRFILVHGAGSFGHFSAQKYGLAQGTKDHPEKLPRALANKAADQFLNNALAQIFLSIGLPVAGINTSSTVVNRAGKLHSVNLQPIESTLTAGAIPLLHGDMVFDSAWGMSICSGDVLVPYLAKKFHAESIFYASDVDGIFTRDPHRFPDAECLHEIKLTELFSEKVSLGHSHHVDVTAGFAGKFAVYRRAKFPRLKTVGVFNGLFPKRYRGMFDRKNFSGTIVRV